MLRWIAGRAIAAKPSDDSFPPQTAPQQYRLASEAAATDLPERQPVPSRVLRGRQGELELFSPA